MDLATDQPGLVLRDLQPSHAGEHHDLVEANREHLARGGYATAWTTTLDGIRRELAEPTQDRRFGLWLDGCLVGRLDLLAVDPPRYSIGYWLASTETGRGLMTSACRRVLDLASTALGATDIFAGINHGNDKSIAVVERLGFSRVVEFRTYSRYHRSLRRRSDSERNGLRLRAATGEDLPFLRRMLADAANWRSGVQPSIEETLQKDRNRRYLEGWGRAGDFGVVAEDSLTRPLGTAWCRQFDARRPGYAFVDPSIPELSVAVIPERRGQGIGAQLLRAAEEEASKRGVTAISLSVEEANPVIALYARLGYVERCRDSTGSLTMVKGLSEG